MLASRKPALAFIFVTLLIDITGWGIIIPVVPDLLMDIGNVDEAQASNYGGWLMAAYAVMQFLCAPIVGALSDRFGRRPVLLASLFGFAVDYLITGFAPTIAWLFLGRIVAGVMGASFTTAAAYIADVSKPEERAQNFGLIGVAFGLGFIIGPAIGGLLGEYGLRVPFFVTAGLTFLNWIYGFFVVPESLKPENRRKFEWKRANPIGTLKSLWRYKVVAGLLGSLTLLYLAAHAVQSNWGYYTKEKFEWGPQEIGISLAVIGALTAVVQGWLIRIMIPKIGQERSVYFGLALYALGFFLFAIASQGWMMYAFCTVYCLGGIAGPALQGIMSNVIPANEQGELQGGFTALVSVTSIFGPLLMNSILFPYFTEGSVDLYLPGAPMLVGAILTTMSAILARRNLKRTMPVAAPHQVHTTES